MRWSLVLGAAVLAGGGYLAWKTLGRSERPTDDRPADGPTPPTDVKPAASSAGTTDAGPSDPYAVTGPVAKQETDAALTSRLVVRRVAALKEIATRGADDPAILAVIEPATKSEDALEAMWAKAAVMRVASDRRYLLEIARKAADAPQLEDPARIVRLFDPVAGDALIRAAREAKMRSSKAGRPLEGLDAAVDRLAKDPKDGAAAVEAGVTAAQGEDLASWLSVSAGLHPVPTTTLSAALDRWRRGTPVEREAVRKFLMGRDADLGAAGPDVSAFLLERLDRSQGGEASANDLMLWGQTIRRLPSLDPALQSRLIERAKAGGPPDVQNVIAIFAAMGPKAKSAARDLLPIVAKLPESFRPIAAQGLVVLGADEVLPYAAERLAAGKPEERAVWLDGLSAGTDPKPLLASIQRLATTRDDPSAAKAAAALVRLGAVTGDGAGAAGAAGATSVTAASSAAADARTAILEVMDRGEPPVKAAAILALDRWERLPDDVATRLEKALDESPGPVRDAAMHTISGAWRLGPDGKRLVPALLRVAAQAATDKAAGITSRALRSLAMIAPDDPSARAAFLSSAAHADVEVKKAAIFGLSRLATPTPAEKAAVAAARTDPRFAAMAESALARPAWAAVETPR